MSTYDQKTEHNKKDGADTSRIDAASDILRSLSFDSLRRLEGKWLDISKDGELIFKDIDCQTSKVESAIRSSDDINDIARNILHKVSIADDNLFREPPPKEDCPICMLPMPYENGICGVKKSYQSCCGKIVCYGCMKASEEKMIKGKMKWLCLLCREPLPRTNQEMKKKLIKRVEINDAEAIFNLAAHYRFGNKGFPKNIKKALKLFNQAAELGSCWAHHALSNIYHEGEGVEKDTEKALHHTRLAALRGHEIARHNLGADEGEKSMNGCIHYHARRAIKHYMIAARSGNDHSLKVLGKWYKKGFVTKAEYASTLRAYQVCCDEMKSAQRTNASKEE